MIPIRTQKIGRNDPCPCGSKKKYKRCHGGIDAAPTLKPGQLDAQLRKSAPRAECLAPNTLRHNCKGRIIASHTVSRSGSLGEIAKDGHVYSYAISIQRIDEMRGQLLPKLTGWKDASTFPGFCAHHDKKIFSPLEDEPFTGSQQQCFLLSYRSNAWEYYAKQRSNHNSDFRVALAASKSPEAQALMAAFNFANELGLRDAQARKEAFDDVLSKERWADCHGLVIEFDRIFPIQCSAAWAPTTDVHGNILQALGHSPRTPEGATVASFAADGKSYFLLSWLDDSATVASKLADSIETLPKCDMAGVIAALLLLTSENCHLSPDWYDALPESGKDWANELVHPMMFPKPTPAAAGATSPLGGVGITSVRRF